MSRRKKPKATYEELKSVWYKKLESKGFKDIEKNELQLKSYSTEFARPPTVRNWHAKSEYYSMAGQFLHNYKFESRLERIIWEYHINGIGSRSIARVLNKAKVSNIYGTKVFQIIQRLVREMKKMYLPGYVEPQ